MKSEVLEIMKAACAEGASETVKDTDAVCASCRGRAGHIAGCKREGEPWPTITLYRAITFDEAFGVALEAIHKAGYRLAGPDEMVVKKPPAPLTFVHPAVTRGE